MKRSSAAHGGACLLLGLAAVVFLSASRPAEQRLMVCHEPPGRHDLRRALVIGDEKALLAHLRHGDSLFGNGLDPQCGGGLSFRIDPGLTTTVPALPGPHGPRPLGVVRGPIGEPDEIVVDEVQLRPEGTSDLQSFLARYGGTILHDDSVPVLGDDGQVRSVPELNGGWYLLRIDPSRSSLAELPELARAAGITSGPFVFSSEAVARALALQLRERARRIEPNLILYPTATPDHPIGTNVFFDFTEQWWFTDRVGPDFRVSTSVDKAWAHLRNTGLPPVLTGEPWAPATVSVVDCGFDLDPVSGLGNTDYNDCLRPPSTRVRCDDPALPARQIDIIDGDDRVGGPAELVFFGHDFIPEFLRWHGQSMLGVCCAFPGNSFGAAGSGGEYVVPVAIKALTGPLLSTVFDMSMGVRAAVFRTDSSGNLRPVKGVISMSFGTRCDWGWTARGLGCESDLSGSEGAFQEAIKTATVFDSIVLASAGNEGIDVGDVDYRPCDFANVICVGGVDGVGNNVFNWGSEVDIWAPTSNSDLSIMPMQSTLTPDSGSNLSITGGTSAATAWAAGVVGMLKSVDPDLRWNEVLAILQETANCSLDRPGGPCPLLDPSTADPKVHPGWIDALRAVQRVRTAANPAPSVRFVLPADGSQSSASGFGVRVRVEDPPDPNGFSGQVAISSNLDGVSCVVEGTGRDFTCGFTPTSLGVHQLTATATDELGASASATISVTFVNATPRVLITSPRNGALLAIGQPIRFAALFEDFDEPIVESRIGWTSSLTGNIAPMTSRREFSRALSAGTHNVTAFVSDSFGALGLDDVQVQVIAASIFPIVQIVSPFDGQILNPGRRTITLSGSAFDPEEGSLTGTSLRWISSTQGVLGTGEELSDVDFDGHSQTITLEATDSDGNVGTDQVAITVGPD